MGLALLTSSTALYALIYQISMPTKLHVKPLFFDYGLGDCVTSNSCT